MKEHYHWTEKTTYRVKESICNHTSDKGLISRICKSKLENKNNHPFKKWAKNWSRQLSTEYIQRVNKHIKRCLISLVIRKTEIKSSMQYHFMPTKDGYHFFFLRKTTNIGKDLEKWESLYIFVENVKFAVAVEKEFGGSSEI